MSDYNFSNTDLTPEQQQYLDSLNIGSGEGTAGAIGGLGSGAARGAALGSVIPGVGTALGGIIGGGIGFFKGLFGGKSKAKKERAAAKAALEARVSKFNAAESARRGQVHAGQSLLQGLAGRGFTQLSPEAYAEIEKQRQFDPRTMAMTNPGTGAVSGALSDVLGNAEDIASQYAINKGGAPAMSDSSAGTSVGPTAPAVQETSRIPWKLGQDTAPPDVGGLPDLGFLA